MPNSAQCHCRVMAGAFERPNAMTLMSICTIVYPKSYVVASRTEFKWGWDVMLTGEG